MPCDQILEKMTEPEKKELFQKIKDKDDGGKSIRTIAKETGLTEDQVEHCLQHIKKKKGMIVGVA
jgi:DNA invertase Pin-like site-specific DNA recombinase